MLSKRLLEISKFVPKKSYVIDIGCDHALLDIYLTLSNNNKCIAADISEKVIENAKKNIEKYNLQKKIKTVVSNGVENIKITKKSVIIISGMGTHTIIDIVSKIDRNKVQKLIIQSNNCLYNLRKKITKLGYIIEKEKVVYDNNKFYTIISFKIGIKKYNLKTLKYGDNITIDDDYNRYIRDCINKNKQIIKKLNYKHILKRINLIFENHQLKKHI